MERGDSRKGCIFRFIELKLDKWLCFARLLAPSCVTIYELILVMAVKELENIGYTTLNEISSYDIICLKYSSNHDHERRQIKLKSSQNFSC